MPVPQDWPDLSEIPGNNSPAGSEVVGPYANDYFQAAYAFIRKLYDGAGLPNQSTDANHNTIINVAPGVNPTDAANLSQVNAILGAPSGTRLVFQQAAVPTGWVIDTSATLTDCAMRFNQTVGTGGSAGWSTWSFGGQQTTDATVLTIGQLPAHNHTDSGHAHSVSDPGHNHTLHDPGHAHSHPPGGWCQSGTDNGGSAALSPPNQYGSNGNVQNTNSSGTGIYHDAAGTGIGIYTNYANITNTGGNQGHTHTYKSPQIKYADCVVGVKS